MELILSFLVVSFITVATPGPSTFLVIRQTQQNGLKAGLGTVTGILAADTMFMLAGALGVASVLVSAPQLLVLLKLAGSLYFARAAWSIAMPYLANALRVLQGESQAVPAGAGASLAGPTTVDKPIEHGVSTSTAAGAMLTAFTMHGFNVKALLFFAMLVPQFIRPDQPLPSQVAVLLALHLGMAATVLLAYALLGSSIAKSAHQTVLTKVLDLAGAAVMGTLSLGILASIPSSIS